MLDPGRPIHVVTTWFRARPLVADGALASLLLVANVVALLSWSSFDYATPVEEPGALAYLLTIATSVVLTWRRQAPISVLASTTVTTLTYQIIGYPDAATGMSVLVALYTVGAHAERRRSLQALAATLLIVTLALAYGSIVDDEVPAIGFLANLVLFSGAWLLGDNLRSRRAYLAELEENVANAERERELEARRAVQEERTRIARELHDVVAHGMSVMVVQATGARRLLGADATLAESATAARASEALDNIETTGREALREMRRLLGVVRAEDASAEMAPQPGFDDIETLVRGWADAGMAVSIECTGDPRPLPAGVGLAAYRVVQEALTNASRHAGPATVQVRVDFRDDTLDLRVSDDGRGASAAQSGDRPSGAGHGLVGMRERVGLYGGSVSAGPRPGGGYEVWARLPVS